MADQMETLDKIMELVDSAPERLASGFSPEEREKSLQEALLLLGNLRVLTMQSLKKLGMATLAIRQQLGLNPETLEDLVRRDLLEMGPGITDKLLVKILKGPGN